MHDASTTRACPIRQNVTNRYRLETHGVLRDKVRFGMLVVPDAAVQVRDVDCVDVRDINQRR